MSKIMGKGTSHASHWMFRAVTSKRKCFSEASIVLSTFEATTFWMNFYEAFP